MNIRITEDEFFETYRPIKNSHEPDTSFDGCMFETYGVELDFVVDVNDTAPNTVWTVLDIDGELIITNGAHFVNRFGYLITEVPWPEGAEIEVYDPDYQELEDEE